MYPEFLFKGPRGGKLHACFNYFKRRLLILFFFLPALISAQTEKEEVTGTVTYLSSQNVYIKYAETDFIKLGDTLFIKNNNQFIPALIVDNKSSISVVSKPIIDISEIKKGDEIIYLKNIISKPEKKKDEIPLEKTELPEAIPETAIPVAPEKEEEDEMFKQKIKGRISAASYSNMSDSEGQHRMRYAFSFRGNNLKNSRFSTDNYITFRHTMGEWDQVQENIFDALKIYALSAKYDFDKTTSVTVGRKINPRISSMGAIDGVQFEKSFNQIKLGVIGGSRPDYTDYSVDFNLMQGGAYISYQSDKTKKYQQSTLGFIEQRNGTMTDRRFVYFQHSNSLAKNLNLFTSLEADLYENINNEKNNTLRLTNLYTSLRYRFSRKISVSFSYDNRSNIIYYESYKNFIDRLIENETRQGLRLGFNIRPMKFVTLGANGSMRFQKSEGNISRNLNSYLTISRIPGLNARATLSANILETGFLTSNIFGARLSKDIIKNKVSTDVYFRKVNYDYKTSEFAVSQNIVGLNCTIRVMKRLSLYVYYEGTYNKEKPTQTRFNTKIIQRF